MGGRYIAQDWERPIPWEKSKIKDMEVIGVSVERSNPRGFLSGCEGAARRLAYFMDKGILPWAGALVAQPARALAAVHLWNNAVQACENRMEARRLA